jgi:hypothetical protein
MCRWLIACLPRLVEPRLALFTEGYTEGREGEATTEMSILMQYFI